MVPERRSQGIRTCLRPSQRDNRVGDEWIRGIRGGTPFSKKMKSGARSPAFLITASLLVAGTVALMTESEPIVGALFFVPFALGPLFISLLMAALCPTRPCQILLSAGSLLYAAWFGSIFLEIFHWHPDPQGAIALIFVGVYSLPVMGLIWVAALVLRRRGTRAKTAPDPGDPA